MRQAVVNVKEFLQNIKKMTGEGEWYTATKTNRNSLQNLLQEFAGKNEFSWEKSQERENGYLLTTWEAKIGNLKFAVEIIDLVLEDEVMRDLVGIPEKCRTYFGKQTEAMLAYCE